MSLTNPLVTDLKGNNETSTLLDDLYADTRIFILLEVGFLTDRLQHFTFAMNRRIEKKKKSLS